MSAQVAVTTQHYDLNRSGSNLRETILTPSNVNVSSFGKLFSMAVDGQIYAQPLYVPGVTIPAQGVHNVIYVCTENNSVYAFDADRAQLTPLWQVNLGVALESTVIDVTRNLQPQIGITGTPMIDLTSNTIYVVAETYENGQATFWLHALDLATGAEKFTGPAIIAGSVPGTSSDSAGGVLTFNPLMHWQRAGLLLWNGTIYIAFGSHQDQPPYHGWVFAYNANTLQQSAVLCTTPNGSEGGIWQGGVGLSVDAATGYLYLVTGNGSMDANTGNSDYGQSVLKLNPATLAVADYFSPANQASLSTVDADLGTTGALLLPATPLGVGMGKDGTIYVFNRNNLGQYNPGGDQIVQEWQATYSYLSTRDAGFFGGPVYYNSTLYVWGRRDALKAFSFNGSTFNTVPQTGPVVSDGYSNEPAMSISANGATGGTGVLWAAYSTNGDTPNGGASPGILQALDPVSLNELWDSNLNPARDYSGSWSKWNSPMIANGKVYLATFDNLVNVYGLRGAGGGGSLAGAGNSSATAVNLTTEGATDWEHWGDNNLNRKGGVTAQLSNYATRGAGTAMPYSNDPRAIGWSGGAPTADSSNNPNGIYIDGVGQGFSFTAPADTVRRSLVVHAGGWNSGGTFTAHLSDGSAPDFVDTTAAVTGQFDRNYTLTYNAASSGQVLQVTWTMTAGTGNVALNAAALSTFMNQASTVAATAGTPQRAAIGTAFGTALQATVLDSESNPVAGATVTFTAPPTGPGATFPGSALTAMATTNASGIATAPTLTANATTGAYIVTASVAGVSPAATFNLTNTLAGSLTGSGASGAGSVNLTTEGTTDWEHWGDGGLNRKASPTAQLSSYTMVGGGSPTLYINDPRPIGWSDGAPTAGSSNNQNGIYINGIEQGFQFTAPADTVSRNLVVHAGGWNSGGTFTAHLSDGSAADFTDVTPTATGQFDRSYTLTYNAASAGQTLTATWTMTTGTGNVSLNAAALSVAGMPAAITATAGTPQSGPVGTPFAIALQATVKDSGGNPVNGAAVTFTAPSVGAGATFPGLTSAATTTTNAAGVATAPELTANGATGAYVVTATVSGVPAAAPFNLTNTFAGLLAGSGTSGTAAVNLTAEGAVDWEHFGDASLNRKTGVTPQLTSYTVLGTGPAIHYNNDSRPISWSDGAPVAVSSKNLNGVFVEGIGEGFSLTAPADTARRTLVVHAGGWNSGGKFTAHLSDGSAPDFTDTINATGQFDRNYTVTYSAAAAGQTLTVTWTMTSGTGNVTLSAAAVQ